MHFPSSHHKLVIYQLFLRVFGNQRQRNKKYGSLEENGCGKFNHVTARALTELKALGVTHIWYTGVLEHATLTDYSVYGITNDHPLVVKGIAGSPYAVKDYYDVAPDLAENVTYRMQEFEALVARTHAHGIKVLMDFIPNHVARQYASDQKPEADFGKQDDTTVSFSPANNFYYVPGQAFRSPEELIPILNTPDHFDEMPAKATGNDVFHHHPSVFDWYETVKLNYGVDYLNGHTTYFDPIPDTWLKMRDILLFWARKGVDGFRCDMAEMVPAAFWSWVITEVQQSFPGLIFIAEIYNPAAYRDYTEAGKFDYLYDKVGLYDALRRLIEGRGNAQDITRVWQQESGEFSHRMLRFLENHDEQRIASRFFAGDPFAALPAMALCASLHTGPLMIYSGQEVGVAAEKAEGFQGDDGRTTIFDYWGVPELQAWTNKGTFDGGKLTEKQHELRAFYARLIRVVTGQEAFYEGSFYDLQYVNDHGQSPSYDERVLYSFLRYTPAQRVLAVFNFDRYRSFETFVRIPLPVWTDVLQFPSRGTFRLRNLFHPEVSPVTFSFDPGNGISLHLPPQSFYFFELEQ